MTKEDVNQIAARVIGETTEAPEKNPAAVALGSIKKLHAQRDEPTIRGGVITPNELVPNVVRAHEVLALEQY